MNRNHIAVLGIALILPTAAAIAAWFFVPRFAGVFHGFGADLPWSTRLLLASYRWWLVFFPLLVVTAGVAWPAAKYRPAAAVLTGTLSAVAMAAFMLWACYSPIFGLAAQMGK